MAKSPAVRGTRLSEALPPRARYCTSVISPEAELGEGLFEEIKGYLDPGTAPEGRDHTGAKIMTRRRPPRTGLGRETLRSTDQADITLR